MADSMPHDTVASAGTNTGTKSHIIPLNNHLNMTNATITLMTQSASYDRKHIMAMYMHRTNVPLKCHTCQLVQVHDITMSVYMPYVCAINNVTMNTGTHKVQIIGICI